MGLHHIYAVDLFKTFTSHFAVIHPYGTLQLKINNALQYIEIIEHI